MSSVDDLLGHAGLLILAHGKRHAPVRPVHHRPESPTEPLLHRGFLGAREVAQARVAGNHDPGLGRRGRLPRRARGHRAHALDVLGRGELRCGRIEAGEEEELAQAARQDEAVVGVEILAVGVACADLVGKREGVRREVESGDLGRLRGDRARGAVSSEAQAVVNSTTTTRSQRFRMCLDASPSRYPNGPLPRGQDRAGKRLARRVLSSGRLSDDPRNLHTLPDLLRRSAVAPARAHRHRAGPERAAGAALGSRAALPADRPASGDDTRRRAAGESADPRRDVLRSPHPATGHGARLRRGDREVDHAQPAARASAAEPGALEVGGGPRAGQLQRLPESRARRVPARRSPPCPIACR